MSTSKDRNRIKLQEKKPQVDSKSRAARNSAREKSKAKAATPVDPQKEREKLLQQTFPDAAVGTLLADQFFKEGALGRVDAAQDPRVADILSRYQSVSDQMFANPRSAETQAYLDRFKGSLEGYNSAENQAMREQASRQVDADYRTRMANLARGQARSNVRGASALAQQNQLDRERLGQQQQMEQDLFVKNADEKQRRLMDYGRALTDQEKTEFDQRNIALTNYNNAVTANRDDLLRRETFNLEQVAKENAGRANTFFDTQAFGQAERARQDTNKFNNKALAAMRGDGRSRSSSSSGQSQQDKNSQYIQGKRDAVNRRYGAR